MRGRSYRRLIASGLTVALSCAALSAPALGRIERPSSAERVRSSGTPRGMIGDFFTVAKVSDPSQHPNRHVGLFRTQGGGRWCSGFLFRPDAVVTAGHCIWGDGVYTGQKAFRFIPQADGSAAPEGSCRADRWKVTEGFKDHVKGNDFGIVHLACSFDIGNVQLNTRADIEDQTVRVVGYPDNNTEYSDHLEDDTMYRSTGTAGAGTVHRNLPYTADTAPGSSGSAVFANFPVEGAPPGVTVWKVVSVHSGGPYSHCDDLNCGVRLDQARVDWLLDVYESW